MRRLVSLFITLTTLFFAQLTFAQGSASSGTTTCNFDDEKQLAVEYQHVTLNLKKPTSLQVPFGKAWRRAASP